MLDYLIETGVYAQSSIKCQHYLVQRNRAALNGRNLVIWLTDQERPHNQLVNVAVGKGI